MTTPRRRCRRGSCTQEHRIYAEAIGIVIAGQYRVEGGGWCYIGASQGEFVAALFAQNQEVGELERRPGTGCHLAFDGSLVLTEDVSAAARGSWHDWKSSMRSISHGSKLLRSDLSIQEFVKQASGSD